MKNCIFCKISSSEIKTKFVYEDEDLVVFNDLHPQAPYHLLIVPRKHIATLNDITEKEKELIGKMVFTAQMLAKKKGFAEAGYRTLFNCNKDGGQAVFHLHLHLLGGRLFHWPPG